MEARVIGYVGPPGSGKTQLLLHHLHALHRSGIAAYVVDALGDLPPVLHDGVRLDLRSCPTVARSALRRGLGCTRIHHLASGQETAALRSVVAQHRPRPWAMGQPAVLAIDECGTWAEADRHRIGPRLRQYLAHRRHLGVWLLWGAQFPRQIHYSMISQSNYLFAFGMADQQDLGRLREGGVGDAELAAIRQIALDDAAAEAAGREVSHAHRRIRIVGGGLPDTFQ